MTTTMDNPIAEYLKTHHKGAQSVISSRELEAAFHIRGPDLRRLINSLRGEGIPICSSDSGYYYAETEEELQGTIRQLRSRIKKIAHACLLYTSIVATQPGSVVSPDSLR